MSGFNVRLLLLTTMFSAVVLLFIACGGGGGSGGGSGGLDALSGGTGAVAIAMTDGADEDFDEINVTVVRIELIAKGGHVTVYEGSKTFNLLDLADVLDPFFD